MTNIVTVSSWIHGSTKALSNVKTVMVTQLKSPFLKGLLLASLYSYLPLLLDPSSFPPGEDAFRLSQLETWNQHTYYGWIPQKFIGIEFYYYSTFLLMYVGIWYLLKDIHRWAGLVSWGVLLFLAPTVYLQMNAGNWLTIVGFFFMVLIPLKLYVQWIQKKDIRIGILAMGLGSLAQFFHTETGAYLIAGLGTFLLVSIKWNWRLSWGIIPPLMAFIIMGTTAPYGTADKLVDKFLEGRDIGKSRVYSEDNGSVITLKTNAGNIIWQDVSETQIKELESGNPIEVKHPQKGIITLTPEETSIVKMNLETFSSEFIGKALSPVIIVVTSLLFIAYYQRKINTIPLEILILSSMVPLMALFTFGPLQISLSRIAIHIVSVIGILTGVGIVWSFQMHRELATRVSLVTLVIFMAQQNLINTVGLWIIARA